MITLNGVRFAASKREVVDTLFSPGGTASGWYKRTATGVILYNMRGERIGGINRHGVLYGSTKLNGRWWHSYKSPDGIPEYESVRVRNDEVQAVLSGGAA